MLFFNSHVIEKKSKNIKDKLYMKIKISADSTCDLPQEIIDCYDIGISPLYVVKAGESLRDGLEICPDDIYAHVRAGGEPCSTAAVNVGDYLDSFGEYLKTHDAIIHFTISESMSTCWQNSRIANEELGNIYTIDSKNLSVGIGILVIEAAEMAANGASPEEIVARIEEMRERIDMSFVVETLEYLYKGGRCSAVALLGANLLRLRPCIEVMDGAMDVGKKYRGAMDKVLMKYISDRMSAAEFDRRRVFIVDSGVEESARQAVIKQVRDSGLFDEVLTARAGCTISSHCGPNTLGIMMVRKAD